MGNDKKGPGLYCQKCRTPIDVDASVDQLNPAAFKLLTGMMPDPSHCNDTASHTDTVQRLNRPNSTASAQRRPSSPDPPNIPLLSASDIRHGDTVGT
jgi:beclin 1